MSLSGDLVIFIDAENASAKWGVPLYVWLCQNFKVRECYCVGNRATVAKDYLLLEGPKFHLVNSMLGKDSADTWLVMLGSRELCLRRSVKKVAILSNDRDFAPLAYLAAERQKKLIIYAAGNSGTEGLKQAIKRTEAGEAASVEVIELDKLVGRQLEAPKENIKYKLLTGARNIIKFPQRLWKKEELPALPGAEVMESHELVPSPRKPAKRPKAVKPAPKHKKAEGVKRALDISFSQQGGESEKRFRTVSVSVHNYLARRKDKLRLILGLASDGEFVEIPFVDGMQESTFVELLIAYKVVKDGKVEASFYHSLGLTRRQKAVYYDREELEVEAEAKGKEHVSA